MKIRDLLGEGWNRRDAYQRDYDSSVSGFGRRHREDDEYHNGPDPEQFKIHCTMTDLETGEPRNRTATITTVHGYGHAINMALKMYHDQGYKDAKVVNDESIAESATAGATSAANVGVGAVYNNKPAKQAKNKDGTAKNALDLKGTNLLTGGSIKR